MKLYLLTILVCFPVFSNTCDVYSLTGDKHIPDKLASYERIHEEMGWQKLLEEKPSSKEFDTWGRKVFEKSKRLQEKYTVKEKADEYDSYQLVPEEKMYAIWGEQTYLNHISKIKEQRHQFMMDIQETLSNPEKRKAIIKESLHKTAKAISDKYTKRISDILEHTPEFQNEEGLKLAIGKFKKNLSYRGEDALYAMPEQQALLEIKQVDKLTEAALPKIEKPTPVVAEKEVQETTKPQSLFSRLKEKAKKAFKAKSKPAEPADYSEITKGETRPKINIEEDEVYKDINRLWLSLRKEAMTKQNKVFEPVYELLSDINRYFTHVEGAIAEDNQILLIQKDILHSMRVEFGIEPIEIVINETKFNPDLHNAFNMTSARDAQGNILEKGIIIEVYKLGFMRNGKPTQIPDVVVASGL